MALHYFDSLIIAGLVLSVVFIAVLVIHVVNTTIPISLPRINKDAIHAVFVLNFFKSMVQLMCRNSNQCLLLVQTDKRHHQYIFQIEWL